MSNKISEKHEKTRAKCFTLISALKNIIILVIAGKNCFLISSKNSYILLLL